MNYKNFFFSTCFLMFSIGISAQTDAISEQFLRALPGNLAGSFLDGAEDVDDEAEREERLNNKPETRVLKLEQGIKRLRQDLYNLEDSLENELNRNPGNDLEIFGSSFFTSFQSTFSPINEKNFSADYILDVDDKLEFLIVGGSNSQRFNARIGRDGNVGIRSIGNVMVAGLPYKDAVEKIQAFTKSRQLGTDIFVNLAEVRDIKVLLIGKVNNPGIYTISGGSSVLSLLHAAGGISEGGSLRSVLHKRNDQVVQDLDLYDALIKGNLKLSTNLRSGDVVVVNPAMRLVSISGGSNYPAIYELKDHENFEHLLKYSMGLTLTADNKVTLQRASGLELSIKLDDPKINNLQLMNGDDVHIPMYSPESRKVFSVNLSGAVKKPGTYSIKPGETLSQFIRRAGGYTEDAYPMAGRLFRKQVAEIEKNFYAKSYKELITFIASKGDTPATVSSLTSSPNLEFILNQLTDVEPRGRLLAEFNLKKIEKDQDLDTILLEGDEIEIPYFSKEVFVIGEVQSPGAKNYIPGRNYQEYINSSGGLARFADKSKVMIVEPNGNAFLASESSKLFSRDRDLLPGTVIYAPRDLGKVDGISLASTLAPVVSSIAISLASLNSISD